MSKWRRLVRQQGEEADTIFPAFQREHGPIPAGIVTRPVEPERFREVLE